VVPKVAMTVSLTTSSEVEGQIGKRAAATFGGSYEFEGFSHNIKLLVIHNFRLFAVSVAVR